MEGRREALWRSWLIPWEGFCIEPVQVFWLAHKNDPHNWQRLLCLNSIWKVYIANWEMDQQPFGLAHNFLDLAIHICLESSSAICDYDVMISGQTAFLKLLSQRNRKRRIVSFVSFLLISYHIRTGLALTALCKSCSQTWSQLTKIYTQPFIPLIVTFFKHAFRLCFFYGFMIQYFWHCTFLCDSFGFIQFGR